MPKTPAAPEDLKVGQFVAIYEVNEEESGFDSFPFMSKRNRHGEVDGLPLEILAIDFPFIAYGHPNGTMGVLDIREVKLKVMDRKYVEVALTGRKKTSSDRIRGAIARKTERRKKKKEKPDPNRCIRCGNRLVRKLNNKLAPAYWVILCERCGWEGERVPCD